MDLKKLKEILLHWAEISDALRIVPRLILFSYGFMLWQVVEWAMDLKDISMGQSAFIGAIVGIAGLVISSYQNSGRNWKE